MKPSRIGLLSILSVALIAWVSWGTPRPATVAAHAVTQSAANRVIIYPEPGDTLAKLQALGVTQVESFGSYWLANVTAAQLTELQKTLKGRVELANHFNQVVVGGVTLTAGQGWAIEVSYSGGTTSVTLSWRRSGWLA